jgi:hypothetical protein
MGWLLADEEEEVSQPTTCQGLLGESEAFALDMLNPPLGQLSQLGWTNARIVAHVLERLDAVLNAPLTEEIEAVQPEHGDDAHDDDDGEEDDGEEMRMIRLKISRPRLDRVDWYQSQSTPRHPAARRK